MVMRARAIVKLLEYAIPFHVADARKLKFENEVFDGAIFGFNGLMQIPAAADREKALVESSEFSTGRMVHFHDP